MDCGASEGNSLRLASVPLVHFSNVIDACALFAREICRGQWRTGESRLAIWDGVLQDHVRGSTSGESQAEGGLGEEHRDV